MCWHAAKWSGSEPKYKRMSSWTCYVTLQSNRLLQHSHLLVINIWGVWWFQLLSVASWVIRPFLTSTPPSILYSPAHAGNYATHCRAVRMSGGMQGGVCECVNVMAVDGWRKKKRRIRVIMRREKKKSGWDFSIVTQTSPSFIHHFHHLHSFTIKVVHKDGLAHFLASDWLI